MSRPWLALLAALAATACGGGERIDVVAAASLRHVLDTALAAGAADGVTVRLQTGGSASLARRVAELDLTADLVLLADGDLFDEVLQEWSPYWIAVASDRLVIGYTDASHGADELDEQGWPQVLLAADVDVGMADADLAPAGYRTLMALRLWDLEQPGPPVADAIEAKARGNRRPDVAELLAPLQAGAVDYAFLYRSTARSAGIRVLELPAAVNLGDPQRAASYERVVVEVAGSQPGVRVERRGSPILYGAALRAGAPAAAEALLRWLLSGAGRAALVDAGFNPVAPAIHGNLNDALAVRLLNGPSSAPR